MTTNALSDGRVFRVTELQRRIRKATQRLRDLKTAQDRAKNKRLCKTVNDCELQFIESYLGSISVEAEKIFKRLRILPYGFHLWKCLACHRRLVAGYGTDREKHWLSKKEARYFV